MGFNTPSVMLSTTSHIEASLRMPTRMVRAGRVRLRLHLAASDYPRYLWHPVTGENPWQTTQGQRDEQTPVTGGPAPSHLPITVLGTHSGEGTAGGTRWVRVSPPLCDLPP